MSTLLGSEKIDLLLGDYQPMLWNDGKSFPHPVKVALEAHVREQLTHYGLSGWVDRLKIERVRTEIFSAISRAFYESATANHKWAPFDPIPIVALHAEDHGFNLRKAALGTFCETGANPSPEPVRSQVMRTATQIATEFLRREHREGLRPLEVAARASDWEHVLHQGMTKAFRALRDIMRLLRLPPDSRESGFTSSVCGANHLPLAARGRPGVRRIRSCDSGVQLASSGT